MHIRKQYNVYPPNYSPGDGYVVTYSKLQAYKLGCKMGLGAMCLLIINTHKRKFTRWISSDSKLLWELEYNER